MDSREFLNPSTIVIIITGIYAVVLLSIIISTILISENVSSPTGATGATGATGEFCSGPGRVSKIPAPYYKRSSEKSLCSRSISDYNAKFKWKSHTVQKLNWTRSLKFVVSPNHWIGNVLYGTNDHTEKNSFNLYPYNVNIYDDGFGFTMPKNGVLEEYCGMLNESCTPGYADLSFTINKSEMIKIGSTSQNSLSCDILDVDPLVSAVAWQYENISTGYTGSITSFFSKGCPFITCEVSNLDVSLECNFNFTVGDTSQTLIIITSSDKNIKYLLVLSNKSRVSVIDKTIYLINFSGVFRVAYFDSEDVFSVLIKNRWVYPVESTISTSNINKNKIYNVDTIFEWTTRSLNDAQNSNLLMLALPHHNIVNVVYESNLKSHPLIGPFRFIITDNNSWILADAVADYDFTYATIQSDQLISVWETEISSLTKSKPLGTVNWCKWLGSIATLILIGDMLQKDITTSLNFLKNILDKIRIKNGFVSNFIEFIYDKTWGGIITKLGLNNCSGNSDDGNSFYESHIGHYGYLTYAYAVAGYFDPDFIHNNKDIALLFVRDVANPYEFDSSFPLWRNKDWYFGYSISSGLSPFQGRGKETFDVGESVLGYYSSYLLASVLGDQQELLDWSLAMLASEIASIQYYFQVASENKTDISQAFIQATVVGRGDSYYEYTVNGGNSDFPARNSSIIVPIVKPFSLISFDFINSNWVRFIQPWLLQSLNSSNIEPEPFGYAISLFSVGSSPDQKQKIINDIIQKSSLRLPYGSTWSSMLYWILSQQYIISS